jgi:hypothetical protein
MHIKQTKQQTNKQTNDAAQHNVLRATVVRRPHKQSVVPHGLGLEFPDDLVSCSDVIGADKQCS